jgi:hypothetical protein
MKITNPNGLPEYLVRAVQKSQDEYNAGECDISVTGLLKPPHMAQLEREHKQALEGHEVPIEDLLPSFLGSAMHKALEAGASSQDIVEQRYFTEFEGKIISGQIDLLTPEGVLIDNKECQTYAVMEDYKVQPKKEWIAQLNIYKWLIERETSLKIRKMQILAMIKDWSPAKKKKAERDGFPYPAGRAIVLDIPVISDIETRVKAQLALHFDKKVDKCHDKDRWPRNKKPWAIVKKLGGKATKLFATQAEAVDYQGLNGGLIEKRETEYNRCGQYCMVSKYCDQYQEELKEAKGE